MGIVAPDIAALSLIIVKRGEQDLPGLTDTKVPRRLGPKRVGKIVKMFNLTRKDDVRDYVVRRKVVTKSGNKITKKPNIQRLITPAIRQRRKQLKMKVEKRKVRSYEKRKAYYSMLEKRKKEWQKKKAKVEKAVKKQQKGKKGKKGKKGGKKH